MEGDMVQDSGKKKKKERRNNIVHRNNKYRAGYSIPSMMALFLN